MAALLADRERFGSLTPQRLNLLRARLQVRLEAAGFDGFTSFHRRELAGRRGGPWEQVLIDLTTINHSSFLREPLTLRAAAEHLVTRIRAGASRPVRAWCAGCAAGQEPYSLGMLLAELSPKLDRSIIEIWASDISHEMVQATGQAIYDARSVNELPPDRLRRSFLRGRGPRQGTYRVVPELRQLVIPRRFDLKGPEWPLPGGFEVVLCRNVAIYFSPDEQRSLVDRLADQLAPEGWLVLGNCEILPETPSRLRKIAPSIYRRALP